MLMAGADGRQSAALTSAPLIVVVPEASSCTTAEGSHLGSAEGARQAQPRLGWQRFGEPSGDGAAQLAAKIDNSAPEFGAFIKAAHAWWKGVIAAGNIIRVE